MHSTFVGFNTCVTSNIGLWWFSGSNERLKDMNGTVLKLEVLGSNPSQATLGAHCISVYVVLTVNQQILAAIKFGVSQNKVIYVNLAAIKFGVSPRPVYVVYDRRICWRRQILAKTRNSPNSPNIIARQNLLIYSNHSKISYMFSSDR